MPQRGILWVNNEERAILTAHPDSYRDVSYKMLEHEAPLWGAGLSPILTYLSNGPLGRPNNYQVKSL
jgi:hypothetical protein